MGASLRRGRLRRRVWLVRRPASRPARAPRAALWPARGAPPARGATPGSLAAVGAPRVLLCAADLAVLEKPADVAMDGAARVTVEKLARRWLAGGEGGEGGGAAPVRFCHRLDYGTSGVLLLARTAAAAARAGRAFETRAARKVYSAVARGDVRPRALLRGRGRALVVAAKDEAWSFAVDAPIGARADGDFRMAVGATGARPARTLVRVVARGRYRGRRVTVLELAPQSGRRHQLRVHMRALGHPLVGDATYDGGALARAPRLMLHARALRLPLGDGRALVAATPEPFAVDARGRLHAALSVPLARCRAALVRDGDAPGWLPPYCRAPDSGASSKPPRPASSREGT